MRARLSRGRGPAAIQSIRALRAEVDERSEKLGFKIREAELRKVPYMLVVGKNEVADGTFSLRTYQTETAERSATRPSKQRCSRSSVSGSSTSR